MNCKSDAVCRFCAENQAFSLCSLAKEDTYYRKADTKRKCGNCFGNHDARYLEYPSLRAKIEATTHKKPELKAETSSTKANSRTTLHCDPEERTEKISRRKLKMQHQTPLPIRSNRPRRLTQVGWLKDQLQGKPNKRI